MRRYADPAEGPVADTGEVRVRIPGGVPDEPEQDTGSTALAKSASVKRFRFCAPDLRTNAR